MNLQHQPTNQHQNHYTFLAIFRYETNKCGPWWSFFLSQVVKMQRKKHNASKTWKNIPYISKQKSILFLNNWLNK